MSTHIEEPIAENSDYQYSAIFVGPDGITPVDDDVIEEILLTIRDTASGTFIVRDEDVTDGMGSGGAFSVPITANMNAAIEDSGEKQLRLMTFKITHSAGKKRNQEVTYFLDSMQDVENTDASPSESASPSSSASASVSPSSSASPSV
jgi:hypothetical protein